MLPTSSSPRARPNVRFVGSSPPICQPHDQVIEMFARDLHLVEAARAKGITDDQIAAQFVADAIVRRKL